MNKYYKPIGLYALIFLIVTVMLAINNKGITTTNLEEAEVYGYGDLVGQLYDDGITTIDIERSREMSDFGIAKVSFNDGSYEVVNVPSISSFMVEANKAVLETGLSVTVPDVPKESFLMTLLPSLITMVIMVILFTFLFSKVQGGGGKMSSFGKSKARVNLDGENKVLFEDVAGCDEEKIELQEVVEFLKDSKKFTDIGAKIPKGVLLAGPPGTGKTLLAKAVAGEAGVPFFSMSGSDFVEMFVGVGASRVRDLFEQAKKMCPSIIFIDEIDAVGRKRGAGVGGGHDEREQTLNQLLVEMDGFGINENVIVIAATNRVDVLDPALLRPGRFDRQVYVGRPDVKGREAILNVHVKGKKIAKEVDLKVVAQTTAGFTGADLSNLLNEAALLSARENKKEVDMEEIQKALIKIEVGTEKKTRVISEKEKYITAYHEAGHAILFEVLSELDSVHSISIIPTGHAGGYTMPLPGEDKMYMTKLHMEQDIVCFLGGRAAEQLIIKDVTTGASNDIERASALARGMITRYGMSALLGPIHFGLSNPESYATDKNYGSEVAVTIDEEVKRIMTTSYDEAINYLNENMEVLHATAKLLMLQEKVTGEEFKKLFDEEHRAELLGIAEKEAEKRAILLEKEEAEKNTVSLEKGDNSDKSKIDVTIKDELTQDDKAEQSKKQAEAVLDKLIEANEKTGMFTGKLNLEETETTKSTETTESTKSTETTEEAKETEKADEVKEDETDKNE